MVSLQKTLVVQNAPLAALQAVLTVLVLLFAFISFVRLGAHEMRESMVGSVDVHLTAHLPDDFRARVDSALLEPSCLSAQALYDYDDGASHQYVDTACSEICDVGAPVAGCIHPAELIAHQPGSVFLTTHRAQEVVRSGAVPNRSSYIVPAIESIEVGIDFFLWGSFASLGSERREGESLQQHALAVIQDRHGNVVQVVHPSPDAKLRLSLGELLVLSGESGFLDAANVATSENLVQGSADTSGAAGRISGGEFIMAVECFNYHLFDIGEEHDGPVCYVTAELSALQWQGRAFLDRLDEAGSAQVWQDHGFAVRAKGGGEFAYMNPHGILVHFILVAVLLRFPAFVVRLIARYRLGPMSSLYRRASEDHFRLKDMVSRNVANYMKTSTTFDVLQKKVDPRIKGSVVSEDVVRDALGQSVEVVLNEAQKSMFTQYVIGGIDMPDCVETGLFTRIAFAKAFMTDEEEVLRDVSELWNKHRVPGHMERCFSSQEARSFALQGGNAATTVNPTSSSHAPSHSLSHMFGSSNVGHSSNRRELKTVPLRYEIRARLVNAYFRRWQALAKAAEVRKMQNQLAILEERVGRTALMVAKRDAQPDEALVTQDPHKPEGVASPPVPQSPAGLPSHFKSPVLSAAPASPRLPPHPEGHGDECVLHLPPADARVEVEKSVSFAQYADQFDATEAKADNALANTEALRGVISTVQATLMDVQSIADATAARQDSFERSVSKMMVAQREATEAGLDRDIRTLRESTPLVEERMAKVEARLLAMDAGSSTTEGFDKVESPRPPPEMEFLISEMRFQLDSFKARTLEQIKTLTLCYQNLHLANHNSSAELRRCARHNERLEKKLSVVLALQEYKFDQFQVGVVGRRASIPNTEVRSTSRKEALATPSTDADMSASVRAAMEGQRMGKFEI